MSTSPSKTVEALLQVLRRSTSLKLPDLLKQANLMSNQREAEEVLSGLIAEGQVRVDNQYNLLLIPQTNAPKTPARASRQKALS